MQTEIKTPVGTAFVPSDRELEREFLHKHGRASLKAIGAAVATIAQRIEDVQNAVAAHPAIADALKDLPSLIEAVQSDLAPLDKAMSRFRERRQECRDFHACMKVGD